MTNREIEWRVCLLGFYGVVFRLEHRFLGFRWTTYEGYSRRRLFGKERGIRCYCRTLDDAIYHVKAEGLGQGYPESAVAGEYMATWKTKNWPLLKSLGGVDAQ